MALLSPTLVQTQVAALTSVQLNQNTVAESCLWTSLVWKLKGEQHSCIYSKEQEENLNLFCALLQL